MGTLSGVEMGLALAEFPFSEGGVFYSLMKYLTKHASKLNLASY